MKKINVRHVPVIDGHNHPIGIVSTRDFFQAVTDSFEKVLNQAIYEKKLEDNFYPYDHVGPAWVVNLK